MEPGLAANLTQAAADRLGPGHGRHPSVAFLVAVSMIERRAARRPARPPGSRPPRPGQRCQCSFRAATAAVPPQDDQEESLLAQARRAAAEHQARHGQPITRNALHARIGVSNQAVSGLLRQLRTSDQDHLPGAARAA